MNVQELINIAKAMVADDNGLPAAGNG